MAHPRQDFDMHLYFTGASILANDFFITTD